MSIAVIGIIFFAVILIIMLCRVHYIYVLKPEKEVQKYMKECIELKKNEQTENKSFYTPKEAEEKLISELVGTDQIRFTVEAIKKYQSSSDPFTDEELQDIMDEELALGDDMNTELIDYILEILERKDDSNG